jgi:hypothetical protein
MRTPDLLLAKIVALTCTCTKDDEPDVVLVSASFLIADAQAHEHTYELLNDEGAFSRLVDLIASPKQYGHEGIHRLLMELLYEMARIQKIKMDDLGMLQRHWRRPCEQEERALDKAMF